MKAEIIVYKSEAVDDETLDRVTARATALGAAVIHTLIGPGRIDTALSLAMGRSELILVLGADRPLIEALCRTWAIPMKPSRRAAAYVKSACEAEGVPLDAGTKQLALKPAGAFVMGQPGSFSLGYGIGVNGCQIALLPADPGDAFLAGDFSAYLSALRGESREATPPATGMPVVTIGKADIESVPEPLTDVREGVPSPEGEGPVGNGEAALSKKSPKWVLLPLLGVFIAALGYVAYTHLWRDPGEPAMADDFDILSIETIDLRRHHYRYLEQSDYDALQADGGEDQLTFLDEVAAGSASSIPDEVEELPAQTAPPVYDPVVETPASEPPPSAEATSSSPPESSGEPETVVTYYDPDEDPDHVDVNDQPDPIPDPDPEPDPVVSGFYDYAETLSVTLNGSVYRMNAYDLVCQVVQTEMGGSLDTEALKAQAVATYTYIKYNNSRGLAPSVGRNTNVTTAVKNAVSSVMGQAVYYNGDYINAVYHSTSCGYTTSAQAVWGNPVPYLVSVESPLDKGSPYYNTRYTISAENFRQRALSAYGIELTGDPSGWIEVDTSAMSAGGYVGRVLIGGTSTARGGSVGSGTAITGRNVREVMLSFGIRSHSFDVYYDGNNFVFNSYGYGHGVGLSQYGAHFMARQGYGYADILEHYYPGAYVR